MSPSGTDVKALITEEGWPCQRLRIAFSLILFFFFELFIGRRLPDLAPYISLALGIALLVSAMGAIRHWKLNMQLLLIQDAIDRARS
jgi:hypothetical protein